MPTLYPSSIDHLPEKHKAEKKVFESLKSLPDHYHVYHSVSFAKNSIDYECDFIIVHEQKGYLCLEVKGGKIESRNGRWTSQNQEGIHTIKNPFEQAKNAMFAFRELYNTRNSGAYAGVFARGVVFPDCPVSHDLTIVQMERSSVLDINDLQNAAEKIEALFSEYTRSHPERRLLPTDFTNLADLLSGDISLPYSIKRAVFERETQLELAEKMQNYALDLFEDKNRIAFQGSAGTGKTYLAMKKAKRLSAQKKRVLFLCYNRRLAEMIRENLQEDPDIDVMTFNSFAQNLIKQSLVRALSDAEQSSAIGSFVSQLYRITHNETAETGDTKKTDRSPEQRVLGIISICLKDSGTENQPHTTQINDLLKQHQPALPAHIYELFFYLLGEGDPWRERIPLALIHLMEGKHIPEESYLYDALIIDEGQDFEKAWCDCLELIFDSYRSRIVYLFYDDNQNIFTKLKDLPVNALIAKSSMANLVFRLRDNLRNTRQIHDYAIAHSHKGETAHALDLDGMDPVRYKVKTAAPAVMQVENILKELDSVHQIPLQSAALISNRSIENTPFASKKIGDYTCVAVGDGKNKKSVKFRTIHEYKGLESDIVILYIQNTAAEKENPELYLSEEVMYVAYTRAKCMLYVVELG